MTENLYIKLDNLDDAYSKFSSDTNRVLNEELGVSINNMAKSVDRKNNINLNIEVDDCNKEKQDELAGDIKKYFSREKMEIDLTIKRIWIIASLLFVFGAGLIAVIATINMSFVLYTIVEICAWVFLWECVDLLCFQIPINRLRERRYEKLIKMKISFTSINDKKI